MPTTQPLGDGVRKPCDVYQLRMGEWAFEIPKTKFVETIFRNGGLEERFDRRKLGWRSLLRLDCVIEAEAGHTMSQK